MKKNCLLPTYSLFSWKIKQIKGKGAEKEQRVNKWYRKPSHRCLCPSHASRQQQRCSECYNPQAESHPLQPEPLLKVSLSSRGLDATFSSALTHGATAAEWVICSPTCSHPALVSFISRQRFHFAVCLLGFKLSDFCSGTH